MNKTQGATTGAAMVLAAGAFLRPAPQSNVSLPSNTRSATQTASAGINLTGAQGEGPWKASCQYWAPVRPAEGKTDPVPSKILLTVTGTEQRLDSHLQVSAAPEGSTCEGSSDPWGIPEKLPDGSQPEITAIVATVPDPERGHLELDFDRTIDALMQAASDNGYVGSYFWLPWKASNERGSKTLSANASGSEENKERKREPGLIILKYGSATQEDLGRSYRRVIYIFLVTSTPTQGVNGSELQKAFKYEAYLFTKPHTSLSLRTRSGQTQHVDPSELNNAEQSRAQLLSKGHPRATAGEPRTAAGKSGREARR